MIRWCGSMVSILIYVDSVSLCFSDVMVSLKNVLTNADTASNKLTLRLETKPLHILLRILDQETASPNISTSPNTERTSKTHLYHQSVGNTVIKCHKLCASTAPPRREIKQLQTHGQNNPRDNQTRPSRPNPLRLLISGHTKPSPD
jgi:hypothetical protein